MLPDVPYGMRAFVRILLLFLLILCLYMPRLLACTRYIVDCEPSWLLISLLHLQLVDYMLYSENSYINNRCAICCASFPHNRSWTGARYIKGTRGCHVVVRVSIILLKTDRPTVVKNRTYNITRRQLALTPGYAFTDYKSQAQTIENVWIDIGQPPGDRFLHSTHTLYAL